MILFIESGATKSDWRLIDDSGRNSNSFLLPGINVSTMSTQAIEDILDAGFNTLPEDIKKIYLYVAGVVTTEVNQIVSSFINSRYHSASVDVQNDLVAAARAICGRGKGIVAIMGTGSNAGFYDGSKLFQNTLSGGYILGDYGSASVLGRMFITDYLSNDLSERIKQEFENKFNYSYEDIINNVYYGDSPSRFLGSFAPFILSHYDDEEYIRDLVERNIRLFIEKTLLKYDCNTYPVGIVGGFGCAARHIVSKIFSEFKIEISSFVQNPIDALITQVSKQL